MREKPQQEEGGESLESRKEASLLDLSQKESGGSQCIILFVSPFLILSKFFRRMSHNTVQALQISTAMG